MASEQAEYTSRTASDEIDAVEICPAHPDFMVFGTYSLVGEKRDYEAQIRKGSINVLPVSTTFKPAYAGMLLPKLATYHFSAAVLDLRFHPKDPTLLGVATSDAKMHFFRFIKRGEVLGRRVVTELIPLGHAVVAEPDEHGLIPLVTQFVWLSIMKSTGSPVFNNDLLQVVFAITLSSHEVKLVKTQFPGITTTFDPRLAHGPQAASTITADIHSHDLEAWTVSTIPLHFSDHDFSSMILSGGDDSKLIVSVVELDASGQITGPLTAAPTPVWVDRKTHSAGVTAILPLPTAPQHATQATPVLTGSYDEFLRLHTFEIDPRSAPSYRRKLVSDINLQGGVWRLKLMDHYPVVTDNNHTSSEKHPPSETAAQGHQYSYRYIILASCMHAGVKIVRVTYNSSRTTHEWQMQVDAEFKRGHSTLVYACDFRRENESGDGAGAAVSVAADDTSKAGGPMMGREHEENKPGKQQQQQTATDRRRQREMGGGGGGAFTVVSTSFYDKKICVWSYVDRLKATI